MPQDFTVTFTGDALRDIDAIVASGKLEFYENAAEVRQMIEQVLGICLFHESWLVKVYVYCSVCT